MVNLEMTDRAMHEWHGIVRKGDLVVADTEWWT
jgi:hypothetical protein